MHRARKDTDQLAAEVDLLRSVRGMSDSGLMTRARAAVGSAAWRRGSGMTAQIS